MPPAVARLPHDDRGFPVLWVTRWEDSSRDVSRDVVRETDIASSAT